MHSLCLHLLSSPIYFVILFLLSCSASVRYRTPVLYPDGGERDCVVRIMCDAWQVFVVLNKIKKTSEFHVFDCLIPCTWLFFLLCFLSFGSFSFYLKVFSHRNCQVCFVFYVKHLPGLLMYQKCFLSCFLYICASIGLYFFFFWTGSPPLSHLRLFKHSLPSRN